MSRQIVAVVRAGTRPNHSVKAAATFGSPRRKSDIECLTSRSARLPPGIRARMATVVTATITPQIPIPTIGFEIANELRKIMHAMSEDAAARVKGPRSR